MYIAEDEFHLFLVCPAYEAIRELYFKPDWKNSITTKQTFYNIMSSNAKSDILSVTKYFLSSYSHRKELLHNVKLIYKQSKQSTAYCDYNMYKICRYISCNITKLKAIMYVTQILHCNVYVLWVGGIQLQNQIF